MTQRYDLITLGAGSGGIAASRYAASKGAKVALCESDRVGGTCVIRGCVPKKLMLYGAQFSDAFADAQGYGWTLGSAPRLSLTALVQAQQAEVQRLEGLYHGMISRADVQLHTGHARLINAHSVQVGSTVLHGERILIATGGRPQQPGIPGIEHCLSSNDILALHTLPPRLLVLGAGYIAMEFAGIFQALGSQVHLAFRGEQVLRGFDDDIRHRLAHAMSQRGVVLDSGFVPAHIERTAQGLRCTATDGRAIEADAVLNALGRRPNTAGLGLEALGVHTHPDTGAIAVDDYSRTSVPGVYAVGDVTDRKALTPVAIAEARAFVDTEFGGQARAIHPALIASAVFSTPPAAVIGLSEADALAAGHAISVYESDFRPMKNTLSGRQERSYMKLVVDAPSQRVLGVHLLGPDSPEILQGFAVAVTMGATKAHFDATLAIHPSAAEELVLMRTPSRNVAGERLP